MRRAMEFLQRHPGLFVGAAAAVLIVVGLVGRISGPDSEDDGADAAATVVDADPGELSEDGDQAAGPSDRTEGGGAEESDAAAHASTEARPEGSDATAPTTTAVPPDVAHPRPMVDLDEMPDRGDPLEVARWWAATHAAHVGAEPGEELADRLAGLSTPALRDELAALPEPAAYGPPVTIEGVSAGAPASHDGEATARLWVTVETPGALVVYDLILVERSGGWVVGEADRL